MGMYDFRIVDCTPKTFDSSILRTGDIILQHTAFKIDDPATILSVLIELGEMNCLYTHAKAMSEDTVQTIVEALGKGVVRDPNIKNNLLNCQILVMRNPVYDPLFSDEEAMLAVLANSCIGKPYEVVNFLFELLKEIGEETIFLYYSFFSKLLSEVGEEALYKIIQEINLWLGQKGTLYEFFCSKVCAYQHKAIFPNNWWSRSPSDLYLCLAPDSMPKLNFIWEGFVKEII